MNAFKLFGFLAVGLVQTQAVQASSRAQMLYAPLELSGGVAIIQGIVDRSGELASPKLQIFVPIQNSKQLSPLAQDVVLNPSGIPGIMLGFSKDRNIEYLVSYEKSLFEVGGMNGYLAVMKELEVSVKIASPKSEPKLILTRIDTVRNTTYTDYSLTAERKTR